MAAASQGDEIETSKIETEEEQSDAVFSEGQLSYLGHDVEEIPQQLITDYADKTVRLDLSFNAIKCLNGLEHFTQLKELILDNNELGDDVVFPRLPSLATLCLNKNKILELDPLLRQLKEKLPALCYLSLLGNSACPNQLSSTEKDEEDYQRYRYYVLFHLPQLKFLDSSKVDSEELREAQRRGQYMQVVRPTILPQEEDSGESTSELTPLPRSGGIEREDMEPLGFYSKTKYTYFGKHSEGNRFIRNRDL